MQAEEETEPSETGKTLEQRSKLFAAFACSNQTASLYQSNEVLLIALSCPACPGIQLHSATLQ